MFVLFLQNDNDTNVSVPVTSTPSIQGRPPHHTSLLTNGTSAVTSGRQQERRIEDASSTVQGLILELSNLNRLIMSTYRDLRQKRTRFPPARGSAPAGKRRREL
ncbi:break repair meiotic recombinase recruitment factor 1 [Pyxicephalus adspersus]|uniref:break repair meiotic recombinase recruitment factor 1 n=1 Tax=Pyxicephalus adspersus TaxID=30357 RepID=UPI003B5BDF8A